MKTAVFGFVLSMAFIISLNGLPLHASRGLNGENAKTGVIAHRGAWKMKDLPQNSIASLRQAINLKLAGSEFDVQITSDDSLVINHDNDFNGLPVSKSKYSELTRFRLKNGENLPTLREYLTEGLKNNPGTRLICEIKVPATDKEAGMRAARETVALVNRLNAANKITYISFDLAVCKKIAGLAPGSDIQYLNGDIKPSELEAMGIRGVDYNISAFRKNPGWIDEARKSGMRLNAWTVNDPDDMDWLLVHGFDVITTDNPELLTEKLESNQEGWKLVWHDEFDVDGLPDNTKWNYDVGGHGWGNNEKQYYLEASPENSFIKNGILHVTALKKKQENNEYTSARMTTFERFTVKYGKIDVRAKLPAGKGTWPAIWMLPVSIRDKSENWPLCGEIDIMEHVGKNPGVIHVSLHSQLYNHIKGTQVTHFEPVNDVTGSFHNYAIEWDEKKISFFVDGKLFYEAIKGAEGRITTNEGWPFDKDYYLILNLAIGGNWGGEVDDSLFPLSMDVDYVRVFKK
ncbi:MAG: family 16 glycosylhydrolase [Bacteroidales bacterium]